MLTREMLVDIVFEIVNSEEFANTDCPDDLADYIRCVTVKSIPKDLPAGLPMVAMEWIVSRCCEIKAEMYND